MRCIDDFVKIENKNFNKYQEAINKVYSYNYVMISKINNCDNNCTFPTNQVLIILKANNHGIIQHQEAVSHSVLPSFESMKKVSFT